MKNKVLLLLILLILPICANAVEYSDEDIEDYSIVIGSYLFTEESESSTGWNGALTTKFAMMGASSYYIQNPTLDNMIIYYKYGDGDWADFITDESVDIPPVFNISHVNGKCIQDDGCPVNAGGGGSSGEIVTATFYYLDEQGNTKHDSFNVSKGDYLDAAMVPVIPERRGIKFDKWTYVNPKNNEVEPFSLSSTINNDIEITATYSTIDYHISYDLNGGLIDGSDVFPEEAICNFADGFNSSNCETTDKVPEKRGYTFAGWTIESLTKSSSSDTYPLIGSEEDIGELLVPELDGTTDIVLYAVWKLNSYEIQYELNDGFYLTANVAGNYNVENTINFATPTKQGFTFEGWYTTSSFDEGTNIDSTENRIGKLSVYAKWSISKANLTYKD